MQTLGIGRGNSWPLAVWRNPHVFSLWMPCERRGSISVSNLITFIADSWVRSNNVVLFIGAGLTLSPRHFASCVPPWAEPLDLPGSRLAARSVPCLLRGRAALPQHCSTPGRNASAPQRKPLGNNLVLGGWNSVTEWITTSVPDGLLTVSWS